MNWALAIALGHGGFVWLWHVPNGRGKSKHNLLKNAKGRLRYYLVCPLFIFPKVQIVCEAVRLSRGESLLENCRSFFEAQICPGPIATNVRACDVVRYRS